MSLATIAASLLKEAGVTADDILRDAGVDREGAIKQLAKELGVDLSATTVPEGAQPVEITDADVATVRSGLEILNRAFG